MVPSTPTPLPSQTHTYREIDLCSHGLWRPKLEIKRKGEGERGEKRRDDVLKIRCFIQVIKHTCVHLDIHTHTTRAHTYTHTHTHTQTHIYTHTIVLRIQIQTLIHSCLGENF